MPAIHDMIASHPMTSDVSSARARCIEACFECASICTSCADACLGEQEPSHLTACIRLNPDCADICDATGRVITRQTNPSPPVLQAQLQACVEVCRRCAEECERHAAHGMERCRICAEACRHWEQACDELLNQVAA